MKTLIIALYDTKNLAKETIDELKDAGIKGSHIEHISPPGDEHKGIFKGLFSQQEKDQKDAKKSLNELTERGISESEARGYANGVRQGLNLLIVDLDDDNLAHSARPIMDRRAYSARPATARPSVKRAETFETSEKIGKPHRGGIVESARSEGISTSSMRESGTSKASPLIPTASNSSKTSKSSKAIPHSDEVTSGTESTTHEPLYSG